jgi:hypothetical protein
MVILKVYSVLEIKICYKQFSNSIVKFDVHDEGPFVHISVQECCV